MPARSPYRPVNVVSRSSAVCAIIGVWLLDRNVPLSSKNFSRLGIICRSEGTLGLSRKKCTLSKVSSTTCLTPLPSWQLLAALPPALALSALALSALALSALALSALALSALALSALALSALACRAADVNGLAAAANPGAAPARVIALSSEAHPVTAAARTASLRPPWWCRMDPPLPLPGLISWAVLPVDPREAGRTPGDGEKNDSQHFTRPGPGPALCPALGPAAGPARLAPPLAGNGPGAI